MPKLNPFDPAKQDVKNVVTRAWNRVVDFAKTYLTAALVKTLGVSAIAVVAAALKFPVFAFVAVTIAIVALTVYAVYATKLLKTQDREVRWSYVHAKRVQQRELEARIAMDTVTLALI